MDPAHLAATHDPASPLHFTPVLVRARRDGWTPDRQRLFVAHLAASGHAGRATALVGMSEQTLRRLRARPGAGGFDAACAAAYDIAKRARRAEARGQGSQGAAQGTSPDSYRDDVLPSPAVPEGAQGASRPTRALASPYPQRSNLPPPPRDPAVAAILSRLAMSLGAE